MKTTFYLLLLSLIISISINAKNPVTDQPGVSDPHVRVFYDTIYLYSGTDSSAEDKTWIMKNWRVFSSTDLVNWELRDTIHPEDNFMGSSSDCWAGDAASRNGKYYFYFSDRTRGIGVMESDKPYGPYKDAIGDYLVSPMHDPTILIDDDKNRTPYIIYGSKEHSQFNIAKLNDDMISLAHEPKPLTINGEEWKNSPNWMDKNYIFKYKDRYYLSWGRDYATSENIYGPYESVGGVGEGYNLGPYAHGSFFSWKGQFYHIWCYYIRPNYKFRETIITYCHMDDNGKIVTDTKFLDNHFSNGVGQYNANWDTIEAEWFYETSKNIEKKGSLDSGFYLSNINDGDWIRFANVTFDKKLTNTILSLKSDNCKIEIRKDSLNGKLLSTYNYAKEINSDNFSSISFDSDLDSGKYDVYFIFKNNKSPIKLDWIKFE